MHAILQTFQCTFYFLLIKCEKKKSINAASNQNEPKEDYFGSTESKRRRQTNLFFSSSIRSWILNFDKTIQKISSSTQWARTHPHTHTHEAIKTAYAWNIRWHTVVHRCAHKDWFEFRLRNIGTNQTIPKV